MMSTRTSLMFVVLDRDGWRRFVAKLAVTDFPARMGDIATHSEDGEGEEQRDEG